MDASGFHTEEGGLEHGLGTSKSLVANGDNLSVGKLVALLQAGAGGGGTHFLLKVQSNIAELLFDVAHDLALGGGGEGVTTLGQNLHEVVCQVPAGQVETKDCMGKSITFIDGNCVRYTITTVHNDSCGSTRGVQRQHGLDSDVHGWSVEGLEHDL